MRIDLAQGEIDISLVTNYVVMYEVQLQDAFPTSMTSIDLADANANGLVEITVGLSYTNWSNKKLEEQHGKMVPLDLLKNELGKNISDIEFDEALEKLKKIGDIFHPKSGFIQLI